MRSTFSNADKRGDISVQIQQRMHLHCRLVLTKLGPRKEREAKIDGGGVQSIQTLVQIDIDRIARIERARDSNQDLRKVIDSPVACCVCVSQSGSRSEEHTSEL